MAPEPAAGFTWTPAPWGLALRADALGHLPHGWSAKPLRLRGRDDVERSEWAQVAEAAGVAAASLVRMHQVHEASVHVVSDASNPHGASASVFPRSPAPQADIAVSTRADAAVAVQVADCVPLLMAGPSGPVAAAHAGWRGTIANVAGTTVNALVGLGGDVSELHAAIGPSIGPCCYDVGAEVEERFHSAGWSPEQLARWFSSRGTSVRLDLWSANRDQLIAAGVAAANVHVSRLCTACHAEWFHSYRRDGVGTGRMAGYIRASAAN